MPADTETVSGGSYETVVFDTGTNLKFAFEAEAAPEVFRVLGFEGEEALFECYALTIELVSEHFDLDLHALLDTPAKLFILHAHAEPRYIHGVIAEIERRGSGFDRTYYRVLLAPALHRLRYHSDSRIFQQQSVPDISKVILAEQGIDEVQWRLQQPHIEREYCTCYQESSYDFLRRLWAEEGMFFWFEHSAEGHTLVVADDRLASPLLAAAPDIAFNATPGGTATGFWVSRFDQTERLRATERMARDYCFKRPAYNQQHLTDQQVANGAKATYQLYQYPGRHKEAAAGKPFNRHALAAHRLDATTGEGESNSIHLAAGFIFTLHEHPDVAANDRHRLLRVRHTGRQPAALEEQASADGATTYHAAFATQPAHLDYKPVNPNPRPRIDGAQIAIVTGPADEEIYCDEHGRVKVWFPWDRHGRQDETSSCWIRVAQNWAGGTWGHMAIPRIGQEVIVEYLEGDPDQPIIIGRTYHGTNRPPYRLPEHKTRMTIKSQTHKGTGFNELRFEDEAGEEEVFMHAQKDHNTVIENDESHQIGHDRSKSVGNDQSESIGHDKHISVGNDHSEDIGNDMFYRVGRNQHERYGKDRLEAVGNILKQDIYADHLETIGRNYEGQINGKLRLDVGTTITTNTGTVHRLMAGERFEIAGPGGKIIIDAKGIRLEAPKIDLKGRVTMGGTGSAQVPTLQPAANDACRWPRNAPRTTRRNRPCAPLPALETSTSAPIPSTRRTSSSPAASPSSMVVRWRASATNAPAARSSSRAPARPATTASPSPIWARPPAAGVTPARSSAARRTIG